MSSVLGGNLFFTTPFGGNEPALQRRQRGLLAWLRGWVTRDGRSTSLDQRRNLYMLMIACQGYSVNHQVGYMEYNPTGRA